MGEGTYARAAHGLNSAPPHGLQLVSDRLPLLARRWLALLLACVWLLPGAASAAPPKRPPPSYGRPQSPPPASHALDGPARVVLFPAWLAFELLLRQPHAALVSAVENSDTVKKAQDTTSDGPWKELTILPAARFDVGLKPMVGLNARWRYHRNDLLVQAGTWGAGYVLAHAADRYEFRPHQLVSLQTSFVRRRDTPFYGLGPRSREGDRARYESNALRVHASFTWELWRASELTVAVGARGLWFGARSCCDEPSVRQAVAAGRFDAPGVGEHYAGPFQRIDLAFDSRPQQPTRGVSFRAAGFGEATHALHGGRRSWLRYGGTLAARADLTGTRRVLSVGVHGDFVDPLAGDVPFTDRASLGGDRFMLGYLRGRLVDRSALVATAEYSWPIWVFLEGVLHAAVGNVFGARLEGIEAGALRYSAGLGMRSTGHRRSRFEALFAIGSRPVDEGGAIDSFRLMVGTQHGL